MRLQRLQRGEGAALAALGAGGKHFERYSGGVVVAKRGHDLLRAPLRRRGSLARRIFRSDSGGAHGSKLRLRRGAVGGHGGDVGG